MLECAAAMRSLCSLCGHVAAPTALDTHGCFLGLQCCLKVLCALCTSSFHSDAAWGSSCLLPCFRLLCLHFWGWGLTCSQVQAPACCQGCHAPTFSS